MPSTAWKRLPHETARYADWNDATLSVAAVSSPRIQPEILFRLAKSPESNEPAAVLGAAEWFALGFEIVDGSGQHTALVVGEPIYLDAEDVSKLSTELGDFSIRMLKDNELVDEADGRNAFANAAPLSEGDLITAGALVTPLPIAAGDVWIAALSGIPPSSLTLRIT